MKTIKNGLFILFAIFMLIGGCENTLNTFTIKGTVNNYDGETLVLNFLTRQKLEAKDTVTIDENGAFYFTGPIEEAGLYNIQGEKKQSIIVYLEPGSSIDIDWDLTNNGNYAISGNRESEAIHDFTVKTNKHRVARSALFQQKSSVIGDADAQKSIAQKIESLDSTFNVHVKESITQEQSSLVGLLYLSSLNPSKEKIFYNTFLEKLQLQYPNSVYTEEFDSYMADLNSRVIPPAIGQMAAEITQESPDGKVHKLSDLRGKYVLLDFWAAWCRPCRAENPNIVTNYNNFKDKNFTVYQVSLDRTKNAWVQAIEQDNLDWPYHVSDLKFWSSKAAKDYAVGSIPASFLIDPDGKIIAKNLRGPALETKLNELLN